MKLVTIIIFMFANLCCVWSSSSSPCPKVLWKDNTTQLIETKGLLKITLNKGAKKLHELKDEEILSLEKTAARMESVFKKAFGYGDYQSFIPLNRELEIYVIPSGPFAKEGTVDLHLISSSILSMLDGKECAPRLSPEQVKKIADVSKKVLNNKKISTEPVESAGVEYVNGKESYEQVATEIALRDPKSSKVVWETGLGKERFVRAYDNKCKVFCNPDIIKTQLVFSHTLHHVVSNNRPYTERHFMVIPKRHISKITEQTDEEIVAKYRLISRIGTVFKDVFKTPSQMVIQKCGWGAGLTQPHLHTHVVGYNPKDVHQWMRAWAYELAMQGKKQLPALTAEEMKNIREEAAPLFAQ